MKSLQHENGWNYFPLWQGNNPTQQKNLPQWKFFSLRTTPNKTLKTRKSLQATDSKMSERKWRFQWYSQQTTTKIRLMEGKTILDMASVVLGYTPCKTVSKHFVALFYTEVLPLLGKIEVNSLRSLFRAGTQPCLVSVAPHGYMDH